MTEQSTAQKRGIKITVTVLVLFILLVLAGFLNKMLTPRQMSNIELQLNGLIVFDQPRRFADIALVDQFNKPFDRTRLQGKWSLVFFGFTHCPDVCPTTLAELNGWYGSLDPDWQARTQIVLVTVDPARDTPEVLNQYVPYFNPDFIGVTGEFLQIKRFANQLNVAFNKVVQGDSYTMDHSAHIALINPKGDYHGFFKPPLDPQKMTATYQSLVTHF